MNQGAVAANDSDGVGAAAEHNFMDQGVQAKDTGTSPQWGQARLRSPELAVPDRHGPGPPARRGRLQWPEGFGREQEDDRPCPDRVGYNRGNAQHQQARATAARRGRRGAAKLLGFPTQAPTEAFSGPTSRQGGDSVKLGACVSVTGQLQYLKFRATAGRQWEFQRAPKISPNRDFRGGRRNLRKWAQL